VPHRDFVVLISPARSNTCRSRGARARTGAVSGDGSPSCAAGPDVAARHHRREGGRSTLDEHLEMRVASRTFSSCCRAPLLAVARDGLERPPVHRETRWTSRWRIDGSLQPTGPWHLRRRHAAGDARRGVGTALTWVAVDAGRGFEHDTVRASSRGRWAFPSIRPWVPHLRALCEL
jgi:hypothetical protein